MDTNYIMEIVNYILEEHNITETATHFHKSRKSIYNYLDVIMNENSPLYNKYLSEKINLTLEKQKLEARRNAGKKSKREQILSNDDALKIIAQILNNKVSLRELAKQYNCSHVTISNAIKRVADEETLKEINIIYNNPDYGSQSWKR